MSKLTFPIETERLLLRPFEPADAGEIDPIYRERWPYFPGPLSSSLAQTQGIVERMMAVHAEHGFSLWLVRDRPTGAVVGDCGLIPLELRGPEIELGYRLGRRWWGGGLATEAAGAALRAGLDVLGLDRILAVTHPENAGSRRVMEKLGMTYQGVGSYYGGCVVYAVARGDAPPVSGACSG
jgi:[ribosomal protein S5]-alanine N-acetyltransferase